MEVSVPVATVVVTVAEDVDVDEVSGTVGGLVYMAVLIRNIGRRGARDSGEKVRYFTLELPLSY